MDCTGSESGLPTALELVRPRGTIVLKTTIAGTQTLALAPVVVDEVTIVGSRCGPFDRALDALAGGLIDVQPLISERFDLSDGVAALQHAAQPSVLKVLLGVPVRRGSRGAQGSRRRCAVAAGNRGLGWGLGARGLGRRLSVSSQRFDEFARARGTGQSQVERTAVRFNSQLESQEATTVTLGLNRTRDQRKRLCGCRKPQVQSVRQSFSGLGSAQQFREQPLPPRA